MEAGRCSRGQGTLLGDSLGLGKERCELRCARNRRLITNLTTLIGPTWSGGSPEPRSRNAAARNRARHQGSEANTC